MDRRISGRLLTLAAAALVATACESATGPENDNPFDAEGALEDFEALELILSSEAMAGFRALGGGITFEGAAPEVVAALRVGAELGTAMTTADPRDLLPALTKLEERPLNAPIISSFRRGKTFVYDPGPGRYVVDTDREGAPDNGVRFILYEAGQDGRPDPSKEVGYADLLDEGDESLEDIALRLVVVEGADTILGYRTTLDVQDSGGTITVAGFLQGEEERLEFDIQVRGSAGPEEDRVDVTFEMGIAPREFSIQGSVSGVESESGEGGEIGLLVQHGADSFQVEITGTEDTLDGTFYLNGDLFATVSGDPDDPTFTSATGEPLTWVELLVLRQIFDSTEDVFDFWEDLLDPVDELVILAIIL